MRPKIGRTIVRDASMGLRRGYGKEFKPPDAACPD
jgi:hypothetical protein